SANVGLYDRLGFFLVHSRERYLRHTWKHCIVFAEPESELEQVPHCDWHGDRVDLELPAIISLDDLAFWRSMRLVLRMAAMGSNRTQRSQGTAAHHEESHKGSPSPLRSGGCKAGGKGPSAHSEDAQTDDE